MIDYFKTTSYNKVWNSVLKSKTEKSNKNWFYENMEKKGQLMITLRRLVTTRFEIQFYNRKLKSQIKIDLFGLSETCRRINS